MSVTGKSRNCSRSFKEHHISFPKEVIDGRMLKMDEIVTNLNFGFKKKIDKVKDKVTVGHIVHDWTLL